jgi:protein NrfD
VVLFLFLSHLGLGIVFTLVFVSREAGVKFFRFNAGLAAILLVVALAFLFNGLNKPLPASTGIGAVSMNRFAALGTMALLVATAAIVVYWATVGRALASIRPLLVGIAVGAGLFAIVAQAVSASGSPSLVGLVLTLVSFLSSAALLGTTCTAMILGHWYLVIPSMQVSHLQSIVKLHIASMVVRVAVVAAAAVLAIATSSTGEPWIGAGFRHYITSVAGIFFWQRVLFGLFGPAVLAYLTWETAKIRSTQSATGILYVDFFTVVVGEALAKYILLATRVPV